MQNPPVPARYTQDDMNLPFKHKLSQEEVALLMRAKARQQQLDIKGELFISSKPNKKLVLYTPDEKWVNFGKKGSKTFLENRSKEDRESYRNRHSHILLKDGRRAIDVPYSPAFLSFHLLW